MKTELKIVNGIDTEKLENTINQIKNNPSLGKFQFRARNKWIDGTHCQGFVKDFYGAGKEDDSRSERTFNFDEPPVLLGNNNGSNPVEYLLLALSGCLTTSLISHASARGINLDSVESKYEGNIDLRGFLGISNEVPVGYQKIKVYFKIEGDVSETQKDELLQMAKKYSPVYNTLTKSVPVEVWSEK